VTNVNFAFCDQKFIGTPPMPTMLADSQLMALMATDSINLTNIFDIDLGNLLAV
jgi:hypothetical protein